jgi:enoyl-CoA hydratase/carnithine racemase
MDPIVRIVRRVPNVFTVLLNRPAARNAVDRDTAIALVVRSNAWGLVCAVTVALK